jgi:hypothetical protein
LPWTVQQVCMKWKWSAVIILYRRSSSIISSCSRQYNTEPTTSGIYLPSTYYWTVPLILDHLYLVGKLTCSKIADTKVRVRNLKVVKLLFQQFLHLSSSQRDMNGPILEAVSNNRWSGGTIRIAVDVLDELRSAVRLIPETWELLDAASHRQTTASGV